MFGVFCPSVLGVLHIESNSIHKLKSSLVARLMLQVVLQ